MAGNRPFGEFLRSRRARMSPPPSPKSARPRRRTPGLKREEVAERAGLSVEWYVKLEQGRAVAPSTETVEALGAALALDPVELAHLRALAIGSARPPFRREVAPQALCRLIAGLPEPAYLTGQRMDVLAWNAAAAALFGDFGRLAPEDRNILRWMFVDPAARKVFGPSWPAEARRMVALFRAAHDLRPGEPAYADLRDSLKVSSPEFRGWWAVHDIAAPVSGVKYLYHPTLGAVSYEYASFQANDEPAIKLALYAKA